MCQPFIRIVLMPDERKEEPGNKTWEFLHSANVSGEQLQLEKEKYLEAQKQERDNPKYITIPGGSLSTHPLRTILYRPRSNVFIHGERHRCAATPVYYLDSRRAAAAAFIHNRRQLYHPPGTAAG
jgi:hypothetical protein